MVFSGYRLLFLIPIILLGLPFSFSLVSFADKIEYEFQIGVYDHNTISSEGEGAFMGMIMLTVFFGLFFIVIMVTIAFTLNSKKIAWIMLILSIIEFLMTIGVSVFNSRNYTIKSDYWFDLSLIFLFLFLIIFNASKINSKIKSFFSKHEKHQSSYGSGPKCILCGTPISGMKFCPNCGFKV